MSSGYKGVGLVRDAAGKPRIDDPSTLHPLQIGMLSPEEKDQFGVWPGAFAGTAQGFKRLKATDGGYIAMDDIVAINQVFDGMDVFAVVPRLDIKAGQKLTIRKGQ